MRDTSVNRMQKNLRRNPFPYLAASATWQRQQLVFRSHGSQRAIVRFLSTPFAPRMRERYIPFIPERPSRTCRETSRDAKDVPQYGKGKFTLLLGKCIVEISFFSLEIKILLISCVDINRVPFTLNANLANHSLEDSVPFDK